VLQGERANSGNHEYPISALDSCCWEKKTLLRSAAGLHPPDSSTFLIVVPTHHVWLSPCLCRTFTRNTYLRLRILDISQHIYLLETECGCRFSWMDWLWNVVAHENYPDFLKFSS